LHYSWTVLFHLLSHGETSRGGAKLLALGSGALLLERKNVSFIQELWLPFGGSVCEEFISD
jgi:hypothetical protein